MRKVKGVHIEGIVKESLPGLMFRVEVCVEGENRELLAHLAGKMKIHYIRIVPGDRVVVEMPDLNDKRGRIIRRY